MMDEQQGAEALRKVFEARGFSIIPDYPLQTLDPALPAVSLDGFDPAARVGFEWITEAAGDRRQFAPDVVVRLDAAVSSGALHVLLVDEDDVGEAAELERIGHRFLDRLVREGRVP